MVTANHINGSFYLFILLILRMMQFDSFCPKFDWIEGSYWIFFIINSKINSLFQFMYERMLRKSTFPWQS